MPLNRRAFSSFGFSFAHSCFTLFWADFPVLVHTSGHKSSGGPHISLCRFLSIKWILWILSKNLTNFDSCPHSNSRQYVFLALHRDLFWMDLVTSYVFQWNRERFLPSVPRVELEVRCDDDGWSHPWIDQKSARASASSVDSAGWSSPNSPWRSAEIFSPSVPALEWVFGIRSLFLTILLYHQLWGTLTLPPFEVSTLLSHDSSRINFRYVHVSNSSMSAIKISPFQVHPRSMHIRRNIAGKTFFPNWWISWRNRIIFNRCPKKNHWAIKWFSKSPFRRCFPVFQEVLDVSQMAVAFPRISAPFFILSWLRNNAAEVPSSVLRTALSTIPSSRIDEVLKFDDSMMIVHRIRQTPVNCQYKSLLAFLTARETFLNSSPSPANLCSCTDKIVSTVLPILGPRQRTGDCAEIHILPWRLGDQLLANHQTSLLEVLLRQCVFCKGPLSSWSASILCNFCFLGSEYKHCVYYVSSTSLPLS